MTIEEMQQKRAACGAAILDALEEFTLATGCTIERVNLQSTSTTLMGAKKPSVIYSVRLTVEL